jgi:nitrite reductase/ring-hydroxylating ferredoxin subunit
MHWIKLFSSETEATQRVEDGKIFTVAINEFKICLVRVDKTFTAFKAICPHAGASLSDGHVNTYREIVCPLHSYRFSLLDGREASGHDCELSMYPIEVRTDGVFLGWR